MSSSGSPRLAWRSILLALALALWQAEHNTGVIMAWF